MKKLAGYIYVPAHQQHRCKCKIAPVYREDGILSDNGEPHFWAYVPCWSHYPIVSNPRTSDLTNQDILKMVCSALNIQMAASIPSVVEIEFRCGKFHPAS